MWPSRRLLRTQAGGSGSFVTMLTPTSWLCLLATRPTSSTFERWTRRRPRASPRERGFRFLRHLPWRLQMWRRPSELSLLRYIESSARRTSLPRRLRKDPQGVWEKARPSRSQHQTPAQAGNVAQRSGIMRSEFLQSAFAWCKSSQLLARVISFLLMLNIFAFSLFVPTWMELLGFPS